MSHELSIIQIRVGFFIVDWLGSFPASCESSDVSIALGDACFCFHFDVMSDSVYVSIVLEIIFGLLHPWRWYFPNGFFNCYFVDWFGSGALCWCNHSGLW